MVREPVVVQVGAELAAVEAEEAVEEPAAAEAEVRQPVVVQVGAEAAVREPAAAVEVVEAVVERPYRTPRRISRRLTVWNRMWCKT